jgi:hypothetical protein
VVSVAMTLSRSVQEQFTGQLKGDAIKC